MDSSNHLPTVRQPSLQGLIEREIAQRTWGRVYELQVDLLNDCLIVRGRTGSYYAKQLALEAVLSVIGSAAFDEIELNIEVVPIAQQTPIARTDHQRLARLD